ncbi:MAG: divergent polysaccharide deacetylase family protein [Calditrichaeota bacterium]|nr:MAG: divergent polysaccharide deacetylase family protein [Calditrichota bacterium]
MAKARHRAGKKGSKRLMGWIFLLLIATTFWLIRQYRFAPVRDRRPAVSQKQAARQLQENMVEMLYQMGLKPEWVRSQGQALEVHFPSNLHPLVLYQKLAQRIEAARGSITQGRESPNGGLTFSYALYHRPAGKITLLPDIRPDKIRGKIAIIIDDFGYHIDSVVKSFMALSFPLTYAIIPGLPYSKKIANRLHKSGKPIIIHMPMEPMQGRVEADGYTLLTRLTPEEIRQRMHRAIEDVPYAVGVNNHMGSKATTDSLLLTAAFEEIKKAGMFFVDSRTTPLSIAFELAQQSGVPALRNTLFLDAIDDSAHVAMKLHRLGQMARHRAYVIGIGHPKKNTLTALQEILPTMQVQGYQFVKAEDLAKARLTFRNKF